MSGNRACETLACTQKNDTHVFQWVDSTTCPSRGTPETIVQGTVSLFGTQEHISIQILDPFARLSDLVPLAWTVCDVVMRNARHRHLSQGKKIPCCEKCSTCCNYLVPLSIPEVIRLYEEIAALPAQLGYVFWGNSLSVAGQLLTNDTDHVPNGESSLDQVGQWYANKEATCPLLKNDLCALYDQRPLACREYSVATPVSWCRPESVERVKKIELPLSVLECLGKTAAQLEGTQVEAVMLPLMLPWIEENNERIHRKWSAREMAQCFLDNLAQ